ncbi:hypothetical protein M407DRAFT_33007 [Tulasnella calospora MUT 4182]|uniref:Uncharacterized protein n=1 Tax=Tulasnella calospora MUT 4182 TaxID=1051891 RepID=A0A0C3L778_9AGAM|nr:hypothetical protein M407DRAFT_33007 [Tulasnella calospora MUT 4182]
MPPEKSPLECAEGRRNQWLPIKSAVFVPLAGTLGSWQSNNKHAHWTRRKE